MPKVDRFEKAKKEAAKTAKTLASERKAKQKELESEYDQVPAFVPQPKQAAAQPKAAANGTRSGAVTAVKGAVKSKSAFAKVSGIEDEDEGDEEEYEAPEASTSASSPPSSKKVEKKSKAKTDGHVDEMALLEEQERAARRQRVVTRFLRFLLVGVLLDWWRGRKEAKPGKSKSAIGKGRKGDRDANGSLDSMREKASSLLEGPFLMLAFTVLLIAVNAFGEGFDPDSRGEGHVNYYDTMGVPRDSDVRAIRKAYKSLALSWHPDKNPGCLQCKSRFAEISEAYETLSDPEKKKAYDQQRAHKGSLESMASVELTAENFERLVLRSSEVWIVQVYSPSDHFCKDFHPIWEDVSLSHQGVARWGRIDQREAQSLLPQRALVLPVVYRFAHGKEPEFITWNGDRDSGTGPLARFVADTYPAVRHVAGADLQGWLDGSSRRARALLISRAALPTSGRRAMETLQFWRVANSLAEFVDIATADSAEAEKALGAGTGPAKGDSFALLMSVGGDARERRSFAELEDVAGTFQQMAVGVIGRIAPHATLRNHHQLCSASGLGLVTRSFCVVLVDAGEAETSAAQTAMNQSQVEYAKELLELQVAEGSEDEPQEPVHIQLVRVSTATSRLPWEPAGVGPAFAQLWREVKYSPAFVLELETRRAAAVKPKNLGEIFQQIAYEDLRLSELPEELPLSRVWADPERGLRRELLAALSTKIGAAAALLLFAVGAAVVPELSLLTSGAAVGSLTALLLLSWPSLCRRVLLPLWCATSSGAFQCL